MTWARLDDVYDDHRKVKRAWRKNARAVGMHAMAISYCSRHETDGIVDIEWIAEKIPSAKERARVLAALVDCELFEPVDAGHFRIHDYLDYNPSRAQLQAKRAADAERKARARKGTVRADSAPTRRGLASDSTGSPQGVKTESSPPVPSRPVLPPLTPLKGGNRKRDRAEAKSDRAAWAIDQFPDGDPAQVASVMAWAQQHEWPVNSRQDLEDYAIQRGAIWADMLGLSAPDPEVSP